MEYDKIELIELKADRLLEKFLSDSDVAVYTNALYFLVSIFLIAVCLLYVFEGYEHLVYIFALLAIIPYRMIIGAADAKAESKSLYHSMEIKDKKALTIAKLDYLSALVQLKAARLKALRLFYMICFPVWLYMLVKIFVAREFSGLTELVYLGAAFVLGSVFWFFYFKKDIELREMDQNEIIQIKSGL